MKNKGFALTIWSIPLVLCGWLNAAEVEIRPSSGLALNVMELPIGARAVAMGEAHTAVSGDPNASSWNPAGLSGLSSSVLTLHHSEWFFDTNFQNVGFSIPAREFTVAAQLSHVGLGAFERRSSQGILEEGIIRANIIGVGFAAAYDLGLLSVGATLRGFHEKLDAFTISGGAFGVGALYNLNRITLGLTLENLGAATSFKIPMMGRFGVSYAVNWNHYNLMFVTDAKVSGYRKLEGGIGFEFGFQKKYFFRGGYKWHIEDDALLSLKDLSMGAGFRWDDILIDYAVVPYGNLGITHRASLAVLVGSPRKRFDKKTSEIIAITPSAPNVSIVDDMQDLPKLVPAEPEIAKTVDLPEIIPPLPSIPIVPDTSQEDELRRLARLERANKLFQEGLKMERADNFIGAVEKYKRSISMYGTDQNENVWKALSLLYYRREHYEKAAKSLSQLKRLIDLDEQWRNLDELVLRLVNESKVK